MTTFQDLDIESSLKKAILEKGYTTLTPIQERAIPVALNGSDVLAIAQTGTGKTAAFCIPTLNKLIQMDEKPRPNHPQALILTPTRELAIQIQENLIAYGKNQKQHYLCVYGGVPQRNQVKGLNRGVNIVVATPGRLLDLISQRKLKLSDVSVFILDETDRMLDMGFMKDLKRILPLLPEERQTLFFSATMPSDIHRLASNILTDPKKIEIAPESTTVATIEQAVVHVEKKEKISLLLHYLKDPSFKKVLVFVDMKHVANKLVERLQDNQIPSVAIHGNKTQGARQKAIASFKKSRTQVMVATDVAARGIDIDDITHVINYDLPSDPESYVHRIGRTGRAGKKGIAISMVAAEDKLNLIKTEKKIQQALPLDSNQPFHDPSVADAPVTAKKRGGGGFRGRGNGGSSRGGGSNSRFSRSGGGGSGQRRGRSSNSSSRSQSDRKTSRGPAGPKKGYRVQGKKAAK